jgi:hypothetical protein
MAIFVVEIVNSGVDFVPVHYQKYPLTSPSCRPWFGPMDLRPIMRYGGFNGSHFLVSEHYIVTMCRLRRCVAQWRLLFRYPGIRQLLAISGFFGGVRGASANCGSSEVPWRNSGDDQIDDCVYLVGCTPFPEE